MKKLLFILALFGAIPIFGQSYNWNGRLDVSEMSGTDTTIQPSLIGEGSKYTTDISGFGCTCTFIADSLTDILTVNMGGSNNEIATKKFSFNGFQVDSLPYELIKANIMVVTNGDTTYEKSISLEPYVYGFSYPMIQVVKDETDVTSVLNWKCKFFKR